MTGCTVVIAAFDAATTIDAALASVAAQDRPADAVVVVDDASSDATAELARRWCDRLPLTVVALAANSGPAVARDVGVRAATTELVALLDSDDYWLPDHLSTMTDVWERVGGVVSADAIRWAPGTAVAGATFGHLLPIPAPERQLEALLDRNFLFMGTLMDRARYERVGGFRPRFRGTEDWDLWIRMARAGTRFTRPDHPTVVYRVTAGSLSSRVEQVDHDVAVMDAARVEATSDAERTLARRGLRRARAQRALYMAYGLAADDPVRARRAAVRGLVGSRRVATRSAAMVVAPRWTAARRGATRADASWLLSR